MLTTLSITSLDQGKALARRQVERLYAEPAEPASPAIVEIMPLVEPAAARMRSLRTERLSRVARFLAFWNVALPIGAWRL